MPWDRVRVWISNKGDDLANLSLQDAVQLDAQRVVRGVLLAPACIVVGWPFWVLTQLPMPWDTFLLQLVGITALGAFTALAWWWTRD